MNGVPCCYFCLGEEADEGGNSPLRDCSCRGDSAGFAHFACIVKYAEQKSKEVADKENFPSHAFSEPWDTCPNCKLPFSNQLSLYLSSAFVSFAETAYGRSPDGDKIQINDEMRVMCQLNPKSRELSSLWANSSHQTRGGSWIRRH